MKKSSKLKCPKCGSEEIKVNLRTKGTNSNANYYRTGIKTSWFFPAGMKTRKSKRDYVSVAVCQNCGYNWKVNNSGIIETIVGGIIFISIIAVLFRACTGTPDSTQKNEDVSTANELSSIWATEKTPLEDFEYYIDDNKIYIKGSNSKNEKVYVSSSYEVDGVSMPVDSIKGSMLFSRADSLIIEDGITSMEHTVFNGCRAENIYLPKSLKEFTGFSYLHNVEKIYYGGTEDEWKELYPYDREALDVVQIICNVKLSDLLSTESTEKTSTANEQ